MRFRTAPLFPLLLLAALSCSSPPEKQQAPAGFPDDRDGATLGRLVQAGSNLRSSHPIRFYLYVPSEEAAGSVEEVLRGKGFTVEIKRPPSGSDWLCLAGKSMVPDHAALRAVRAELDELAARHAGEYDGWETQVVR